MMRQTWLFFFPNIEPESVKVFRVLKFYLKGGRKRRVPKSHIALIRKYVHRGDVVFDIGANIGDYTHQFLKQGATVYAFEPSSVYRQLWERFRYNPNVTCIACALGNKVGWLTLTEYSDSGHNTVVLTGQPSTRLYQHRVWCLRLNVFRFLAPKFIKIDCEGMDYQILLGGKELLRKYHPIVLVEFSSPQMNYPYPTGMISYMRGLGYEDPESVWTGSVLDLLFKEKK